jgi:signal transduction histidine kinase
MFVNHTCGVLAHSTEMENILNQGGPPSEDPYISQGLLKRMLLRYPFGHVVSADEYGVLSTPRVVRGFPNGNGFAQYDLGSRTAAEDSREADDVTELFRHLPRARSVVFLPIWNFQKGSWFSVIVGWTKDPVRIFNTGDLDYLSAFGNSIMAEVSRIEASALSLAKSDFISSISHELRSPLHGILAGTELLRDSMTQSSESAMLNNIDACGNMLLDTMNHLLDYAKYVIDQFFVRDTG